MAGSPGVTTEHKPEHVSDAGDIPYLVIKKKGERLRKSNLLVFLSNHKHLDFSSVCDKPMCFCMLLFFSGSYKKIH